MYVWVVIVQGFNFADGDVVNTAIVPKRPRPNSILHYLPI